MTSTGFHPSYLRATKAWSHLLHLAILVTSLAVAIHAFAASSSGRPFWTEKSAFHEGDDLFVVGIASKAETLEVGRQLAFEHGKRELMNFAQISHLNSPGLVIETQMTFEELHADNTVTVYRLLRVSINSLLSHQEVVQRFAKKETSDLEPLLDSKNPEDEKDQERLAAARRARISFMREFMERAARTVAPLCSRLFKGMTRGAVQEILGEPLTAYAQSTFWYARGYVGIRYDLRGEVMSIEGCP